MMRQIPLRLPHDAAMGADDFLVTPSNRDAFAWIEKWPDWPVHGLILTGGAGSGKTHLINLWMEKSGGISVAATQFIAPDILARFPANAKIAIDDAGMLAGNAAAEEALFHLYNHLESGKGSLLLALPCGAGQAGFKLPDLRSRLLTLPVAALGAPDDALLSALIVKQFRDRQVALDAGVVSYVAARAARDTASIRDLVEKLDHAALAEGCKITIALARKIVEGDNAG